LKTPENEEEIEK